MHALPVPPGWLRAGTNLFALRVRNIVGQGGLLGGPVGLFETGAFLPVIKRLDLQRESTRVALAALCFGWALVPLGFRLVVVRSGHFAGVGLPALLLGIGVALHTQWAASLGSVLKVLQKESGSWEERERTKQLEPHEIHDPEKPYPNRE